MHLLLMTNPNQREETIAALEQDFPGHTKEEYQEAADNLLEYFEVCKQIFRRVHGDPVAWQHVLEQQEIQRELGRGEPVINTGAVDSEISGSSFRDGSLQTVPEVAEDPKCKRLR